MIFAPVMSFSLLVAANGFFLSFVSLYFKSIDLHPFDIGLVQSSYSLGLLISTLHAQKLLSKIGYNRSFGLVCLLLAGVTSLHAAVPPILWFMPRFLAGLIIGAFFVLIESWLLIDFADKKGLAMGWYTMVLYISVSFGQLWLPWAENRAELAVLLTSGFFLTAMLPLRIKPRPDPRILVTSASGIIWPLICKSPIGILGALASGLLLGSIYAFMPIYISERGFSPGPLMSFMVFGGASLQLLVGKISDRFDRRKLLVALVCLGCFCAYLSGIATSMAVFSLAIFFMGGTFFAVYPVAAAIAGDDAGRENLPKMPGVMLFSYSVGAVIGPLATSVLKASGDAYMQLAVSAPSLILIIGIGSALVLAIPQKIR